MKDKKVLVRTDGRQGGLYTKKPLRSGEYIKDICAAEVTNLKLNNVYSQQYASSSEVSAECR